MHKERSDFYSWLGLQMKGIYEHMCVTDLQDGLFFSGRVEGQMKILV